MQATIGTLTARKPTKAAIFAERKAALAAKIESSDAALYEAMRKIHARQTAAEQMSAQTIEDNGMGWGGTDAEFMTSLIDGQFGLRRGYLSEKQRTSARRVMKRYIGQLIRAEDEAVRDAERAAAELAAEAARQAAELARVASAQSALTNATCALGAHVLGNAVGTATTCPADVEDEERAMQRMEAEADRAGTIREEALKWAARNRLEGRVPSPMSYDYNTQTYSYNGPVTPLHEPPCMQHEYCDGEPCCMTICPNCNTKNYLDSANACVQCDFSKGDW